MSDFFLFMPKPVCFSNKLNSSEKLLWLIISSNKNSAGFCRLTNSQLAERIGKTPNMVSIMLANLKECKFLGIMQEVRTHSRRLYAKYPGEFDEQLPTPDEIEKEIEMLKEACSHGVKLDDITFQAVCENIRYSPILDELEDNEQTQFVLNKDQVKFLGQFMTIFPEKEIDMQLGAITQKIDYERLLAELRRSEFLTNSDNLSLRWCIDHADEIIAGKYAPHGGRVEEKKLSGRRYTREEIDSLIQSVDEIEI